MNPSAKQHLRAAETMAVAPTGTLTVYGHTYFNMPNGRVVVRKVRLAHDFMIPSLEIAREQTQEIRGMNPQAEIVGKLVFSV